MTEPNDRRDASPGVAQPAEAELLRDLLRSPSYLRALLFCALIGIPVSLAAFWFLAGLHALQNVLWDDLPHTLGWDSPPWWWPLPLLPMAGLVVGLVVSRLTGAGGHIPASGLHAGGVGPSALPGVVIAAVASLPLGAVLGPEAPLIAFGGGLALLFRKVARRPGTPQSDALLGAAGAAAAIAVIFGNPLVAAVLLIEVAGVGGPRLVAVMLPALLSSGVGSLVFTGFVRWTGLRTGGLALRFPGPPTLLDIGDVGWSVVVAAFLGVLLRLVFAGGRLTAAYVSGRPLPRTVLCALGAGCCASLYAVVTGRSPAEVASSGQATLADLVADPHAWGTGALVAVLLFKAVGYALCLGSLRGGPVFPALFLGAAFGLLLSPLPGLGVVPGVAAGMAAAVAGALRLPVSSAVLVVLLLRDAETIPVVVLSVVVAFVTGELVPAGPKVVPVPARPPRRREAAGGRGGARGGEEQGASERG
ncbi:chloride channel protein [Streptomyces sp. SP18CS02]|uniref:chloride channel protein n=1 Tax=Streptomyces sp. SP18CS02 TaxID=3002531 RepID=UPI002E77F184|nr:chloride channel protein [Streptomyces sp. SP18CS02]MEE1752134.1 chloride channel protein [Streptomyces sp. SP18CS02]